MDDDEDARARAWIACRIMCSELWTQKRTSADPTARERADAIELFQDDVYFRAGTLH
jgi:hypothetical protein